MDDTRIPIGIQEIKLLRRFKNPKVFNGSAVGVDWENVCKAIANGWLLRTEEIWHQTNMNFPCEIAVNGTHEDRIKAYSKIRQLWGMNKMLKSAISVR